MNGLDRIIGLELYGNINFQITRKTWGDFCKQYQEKGKLLIVYMAFGILEDCLEKIEEKYSVKGIYAPVYSNEGKEVYGHRVKHVSEMTSLEREDALILFVGINEWGKCRELLNSCKKEQLFIYEALESHRLSYRLRKRYLSWKYRKVEVPTVIINYVFDEKRKDEDVSETESWKEFYTKIASKPWVVFGAGKACTALLETIEEKPAYVIDNAKDKWGQTISGVTITDPKIIEKNEYVVLISTTRYIDDIKTQLDEKGVTDYFSYAKMEQHRIRSTPMGLVIRYKRWLNKKVKKSVYRCLPINPKKIVINRHNGLGYGCNQKYLCEYLLTQNKGYKIIWLLSNMSEASQFPKGITPVKNNTNNKNFHMNTAKILIFDTTINYQFQKRKGQYCMNTTHGCGVSLKKFGLDAPDVVSDISLLNMKNDSEQEDLYLAGSKFVGGVYSSAFMTKCPVGITGSPRIDAVINQDDESIRKVFEFFKIPDNSKIVLYAPTFRSGKLTKWIKSDDSLDGYNLLEAEMLREVFHNKFGGEWYVLMRFHPIARWLGDKLKYNEYLINASYYADPQELIQACDVLISDYSSIIFDGMLGNKKCFLYVPDWQEYFERERELYFPLESLPFPRATNFEEFENLVKEYNYEEYSQKKDIFLEPLGMKEDGKACQRVGYIVEKMVKDKNFDMVNCLKEVEEIYG